jgi:LmbE family N-acetylglucosaminyl deacetylase
MIMKKISRRNMIGIAGISAAGSLIGPPAFSGLTVSDGTKMKIIVVGAHPGDPECGCGGSIALFTAEGHEVIAAYLTRGGGGIQGKSDEEASGIRTEEALKACKILNARPVFFKQTDGNCEITRDSYNELNDFIKRENPDIVFTHWPIDSHRDHRICSILTYDAWISMGKKFALYYYEVTSGSETQNFTPTDYIDIGNTIKQKDAACMAHISQEPDGWYKDIQATIQRLRGIELNCKYAEAFVRHNQNPGRIAQK